MKKILIIAGTAAGLFFSVWDSMVSYADTAPLDDPTGIEIISWPFFIKKTLIYMLIGGISGWIISLLISYATGKKDKNRIS